MEPLGFAASPRPLPPLRRERGERSSRAVGIQGPHGRVDEPLARPPGGGYSGKRMAQGANEGLMATEQATTTTTVAVAAPGAGQRCPGDCCLEA